MSELEGFRLFRMGWVGPGPVGRARWIHFIVVDLSSKLIGIRSLCPCLAAGLAADRGVAPQALRWNTCRYADWHRGRAIALAAHQQQLRDCAWWKRHCSQHGRSGTAAS
jgi:hypothetical protein